LEQKIKKSYSINSIDDDSLNSKEKSLNINGSSSLNHKSRDDIFNTPRKIRQSISSNSKEVINHLTNKENKKSKFFNIRYSNLNNLTKSPIKKSHKYRKRQSFFINEDNFDINYLSRNNLGKDYRDKNGIIIRKYFVFLNI